MDRDLYHVNIYLIGKYFYFYFFHSLSPLGLEPSPLHTTLLSLSGMFDDTLCYYHIPCNDFYFRSF